LIPQNHNPEETIMNRKHLLGAAAAITSIASAFFIGIAVGEQAPPTENKGMNVSKPTLIELGQEIDSVEGRQLRLRVITFEPGGTAAIHSHKGRPAIAYIVQGTVTEHRDGGWVKEHPAGDTITETHEVTHWAENTGDKPAIIIAVDVFKP
jgi:quercetin dioxygenase-like cupin family protein